MRSAARVLAWLIYLAGRFDANSENMIIAEHIGIGFAVAAPQGLVVPVVKDAAEKTLPQIAIESDMLLKKARVNKLMPDDFDGANVVLSGLGMYGVDSFYAIAPPGSTGIISIGTINEALVPKDKELATRRMMTAGLAVDQRIVNEAYAARFLKRVAEQIENPGVLTK